MCGMKMSRPSYNNMIFRMLFAILIIIHIACTTVSPAKTISLQQTPLHVAVSESAEIFCNYTAKKELKAFNIQLLKGVEERHNVCSSFWNGTWHPAENKGGFNCHVNFTKNENRIRFYLQNLHINQTDIYVCQIETVYPPPHEASESFNGTLIHVKGVPEAPKCQCHQHGLEYMLMITVIGIFIFYGVVVTAACYYCWRKAKKNKVVRNDYFNMTPWQSNGAKKRQPQLSVPVRNYTAYRSWEP